MDNRNKRLIAAQIRRKEIFGASKLWGENASARRPEESAFLIPEDQRTLIEGADRQMPCGKERI